MTDPAYQLAASRLFLAQEDVTAIEDLARPLAAGSIVIDLGAGSGTTALALFCANPLLRVHTIDIDAQALHWARLNLRPHFPDAWWNPIQSDAAAAAAMHADADVDLLLHDAGHEYEDVHGDVLAWWPKLRPGAYVWVHDFAPAPWQDEHYPGVAAACEALVLAGHLEPVGPIGLGWIGRKRP
jgi:precorrin-6B methylase 2